MTEPEALDALRRAAVEMAEAEAAQLRARDDETLSLMSRMKAIRDNLAANIAYFDASKAYARTVRPHED